MNLFEKYFDKALNEDNVAASGGVFGSTTSGSGGMFPGGGDFYAPGDARIPDLLGSKTKKKRKKKRKNRKKRVKRETISVKIQRRNLNNSM